MRREKLMNLVIDPTIQVREVDNFTVSKYAQAMRSGAEFPPLILEQKTNRVICGNNRYFAYKKAYGPEHEVPVKLIAFKDEAEIIRFAARDNSVHGLPMDTWDQKRVAARLKGYGDSPEQIAEVLSVPVKKIEEWAGMTVVVVGKGKKPNKAHVPIKHGLTHLAGKTVKNDDYEHHCKHDFGIAVKNMAAMITRHIESGWIDTNDEKTMENLENLHRALCGLLKREEAA